jgi:hypothetical protein
MLKRVIILVFLNASVAVISFSCKPGVGKTNSNLQKIDLGDIPQKLKEFPLSWERFGVEAVDTVTYSFCNASNPEFFISKDYKTMNIVIGNELDRTFKILGIYYNDSIFKISLEPNNAGLENCVFKWIDKQKMIGTLLLYEDESGFEYLPKSKLTGKPVIDEECD